MKEATNHGRTPPYASPGRTPHYFTLLRLAHDLPPGSDTQDALAELPRWESTLWPLLPRLHANLRAAGLEPQLPGETRTLLQQGATRAIAANLVNEQWLKRILEQFGQAQIGVILLKSSAFSHSLYPAEAPRVGRDLDLLVREEQFERACRLMEGIMHPVVLHPDRPVTHATLFERVFRPADGTGPTVEIHRGLTNPGIFHIGEEALWETSLPHPRYGSRLVRMLSPEHSLLHLAVHAFRDLDFCTHNLVDAHRILTRWRPDGRKLADTAGRWGARTVLHCLLDNCRTVMGSELPETLHRSLRPAPLRRRAMRAILRSPHNHLPPDGRKSRRYRLLQLLAQWTFPDSPHQGMAYQLSYAGMRAGDTLKKPR